MLDLLNIAAIYLHVRHVLQEFISVSDLFLQLFLKQNSHKNEQDHIHLIVQGYLKKQLQNTIASLT